MKTPRRQLASKKTDCFTGPFANACFVFVFFTVGLFDTSPSQVSTQSQDLVGPPPAIRAAFQQTSNTQVAIESLEGAQTLSNSPVIKKEPDLDAICESSDLHITTG